MHFFVGFDAVLRCPGALFYRPKVVGPSVFLCVVRAFRPPCLARRSPVVAFLSHRSKMSDFNLVGTSPRSQMCFSVIALASYLLPSLTS